jgi:hypothetical protein
MWSWPTAVFAAAIASSDGTFVGTVGDFGPNPHRSTSGPTVMSNAPPVCFETSTASTSTS